MALHLVVDPPALFARWHALLEVDGIAVFSCLGPGTLRELRELYARLTAGRRRRPATSTCTTSATCSSTPASPIRCSTRRRSRCAGDSAAALLAELRQLGGNTAPDRFAGPAHAARGAIACSRRSSERADADGSIGLSVEVAYGHGFKPAPRLRADAPVAVSLDDMRAMVRRPRPSS